MYSLADETSYINYIKPLILALELKIPHVLSCIDTKSQWFYRVHPERMVPSLKDQDPVTGEEVIVFEGTACLQYLADRWDRSGEWSGRTAKEKGDVLSWTAYQTAGIGYVLHFTFFFYTIMLMTVIQCYGEILALLPKRISNAREPRTATPYYREVCISTVLHQVFKPLSFTH